jgi:hypothetical protein
VLAAAARRFFTLLAGVAGVTALASLVLGLAAGASVDRSISLGFYLVGSFLMVVGFFLGNRGPARLKSEEGEGPLGHRRVRWATLEERTGALNESAVFVSIGFALILLGLLIDQRSSLF